MYGPAEGYAPTTSCVNGSLVEVAWKNGIEILERNVVSGLFNRMISLLPLTTTPPTCVAWPSLTAFAPTISVPFGSVMNWAPGDARSLFATRSIAYAKLFAVTGVPSLNRKPFRMRNVYVLPPFETVKPEAASGK